MSNIRLQERDLEVIKSLIDYNGLPLQSIIGKYFSGIKYAHRYGHKRIRQLYENDYIDRVYYYAPRRTKNGRIITQRIAAIYYAKHKGCKVVESEIDTRHVIPEEDKLDAINLVGKLLASIPNLLSKRQTIEKHDLQNFMPFTCIIDTDPVTFIYVLGNNPYYGQKTKTVGFIKSQVIHNAKHFIVSRNFDKEFFLPNTYFVPWNFAPKYLTNIAKDINYYAKEFLSIAKQQFPGLQLLNNEKPLAKARYKNRIFNIGELVSGSNQLRLILQEPPENTLIYAPSRQHFYGVSLKQGSFLFYSKRDKKIFKMALRNGNMYSTPYN